MFLPITCFISNDTNCRLLPLYASVILITIAYSNYLGTGPFNTFYTKDRENPCDKNWWTNLLYVNNFFKMEDMVRNKQQGFFLC